MSQVHCQSLFKRSCIEKPLPRHSTEEGYLAATTRFEVSTLCTPLTLAAMALT
jgi:hypothetical protein